MTDIEIRIDGVAGRITLNRPGALNALTYDMCLAVENALDVWAADDRVHLVIIDGKGDKAFCAGGDITDLYDAAKRGDFAFGQQFWRDEYRMNAKMYEFPKPVVSFLQGFTMGGGVGLGCHASHRIVCETSQIAMPEVGIGLVPDVGGSLILARAPGRLGEYLATTAARMNAGDAIYVGFADYYIEREKWNGLIQLLAKTGDIASIETASETAPVGPLSGQLEDIDRHFGGESLTDILNSLNAEQTEFTARTFKALSRNSPLSMACAIEMVHRNRAHDNMRRALELEYRFTYRATEHGDFIEGIRAAIIDKTRDPKWKHRMTALPPVAVSQMLLPLGKHALTFDKKETHMKIGFIGLGNMGAPMAANLAAAGHTVTGFDVAGVSVDGVTNVATSADAAHDQDIVITMLPNGDILRAVATEILPVMATGSTHIDCSTVDVDSARDVAQDAEIKGIMSVDAPVSGGTGGAVAGTLTFMAGGSDAAFAKAAPLFEIMGQKAVHCGTSGAGQSAKICNNMILGVTMIATCEAFALADKLGLSREKMFDVVSTSSGYSWAMNAYCPAPGVGPKSPADNDYQPGFAADLMLKDLRLSQQAAASVDADTPMGQNATELYEQFVEKEGGTGMDFSAMLPRFEKRSRG